LAKLTKGEKRLKVLEKEIKSRDVRLGYERLQYAGLMLKSGLCWFKGRYYLFVDRRKKVTERIELLEGALDELDLLAAEGKLDRPFSDDEGPAETAAESVGGDDAVISPPDEDGPQMDGKP
jgi:hypothetical protein